MLGKFFGRNKAKPVQEDAKTEAAQFNHKSLVENASELLPGAGPLWSIRGPEVEGSEFCLVPNFNGEVFLLADVQFDVRYSEDLITVKPQEILYCSESHVSVQDAGGLKLRQGIPTVYSHLAGFVWTQTVKRGSFTVKSYLLQHDNPEEYLPSEVIGIEATQITQSGEPLVMNYANGMGTIAVNKAAGSDGGEALTQNGAEAISRMLETGLWNPMLDECVVVTFNPIFVAASAAKGRIGIEKASEIFSKGIMPVCRGLEQDDEGDVVHSLSVPVNIEFDRPAGSSGADISGDMPPLGDGAAVAGGPSSASHGTDSSFPVQTGRAVDPLGLNIGGNIYLSGDGEATYRVSDNISVDDGGVNVELGGLTFGSKGVTTKVAGVEVNLTPSTPFEKLSEPTKSGGFWGQDKKNDTEMGLFGPKKKKKGFFD